MKKLIFAITSILALLAFGCVQNNDDSDDNTALLMILLAQENSFKQLASQGMDFGIFKEPTATFKDEDKSGTEFGFSFARGNFEMKDGYIHINPQTETSANWVLSSNYIQMKCTGFEADIKLGNNMESAGLELFKKNSFDCYTFTVHSDGKFKATCKVGSSYPLSFTVPSDRSYIDTGKFNRIQVISTDSGSIQIFVNGHHIRTLSSTELAGKFPLTDTDKIAVRFRTSSNPAEAWIKMQSIQNKN